MALKIQNDRLIKDAVVTPAASTTKTPGDFSKQINVKQAKLQSDALNQLLAKINEEGSRLLRNQTVKDLNKYKKYVHQFMQEAVRYGLHTENSRSWHQQPGSKHTLVKQVDQKLIELTDQVLSKSNKSIDLLGKVGEIKGLLVNFYI